jgi:hypothetical protein
MMAGCADSRMAASNATSGAGAQASSENTQARRPAPYQAGYGLSSDGPTTDLYTELFRSNPQEDKNAPANAPAPATAPSGTVQQGQPALASNATRQESAAAQAQPASAAAQAQPATATVYGLSSNGTTTDLYTELFGPRSHE